MPKSFVALALLMSVAAALCIVVPAYRSSRSSRQSWLLSIGVFAAILVGGTAVFYNVTSQWNWQPDGVPDGPFAKQLYSLQRAVHENENDANAWAQLGRFYLGFEQQLPSAIESLEKSVQLSRGRDIETNLNLVEALAARSSSDDAVRSAEILSASLRLDPDHRKALWYGGEVAASLGQWDVAIARWQRMLSMSRQVDTDEARSVTRLLEERIKLAQTEQSQSAAMAHAGDKSNAPEAVRVRVSLDQSLSQTPSLRPSTVVFVFVRPKQQQGPPLAVHRATVGQLPLDVVLSDADAMLPTRKMSGFDDIEVVARIALGGKPVMTPGDLFGRKELGADDNREVSISIDQVATAD